MNLIRLHSDIETGKWQPVELIGINKNHRVSGLFV